MAKRKVQQIDWTNFPIKFLKAVLYSHKTAENMKPEIDYDDKNQLSPYMDSIFNQPEYFVKKYRSEIEDYFLSESNHLKSVLGQLNIMNDGNLQGDNLDKVVFNLKQKPMSQTMINAYSQEIINTGFEDMREFKTKFPRPVSIDLTKTVGSEDDVVLREYQQQAVYTLKKHFIDENNAAGILQMPTGSGKTLTAVYFLLTEMVPRGYQVVWLAHRSMLIEQAAETFYKFASLINTNRENKLTRFNMICVSSDHSHATQISKKENVIVAMVPSLYYNKKRLRSVLQSKVMIVVDEAHHTLAPTYRTIIDTIRQHRPDSKLLGLSATPVRSRDKDTQNLWKIFESNKAIFDMTMNKLISNGTLSKPIPTSIETNVDIETIIDDKEIAHIQKMHEMPESLINKIAKTNTRNDLIVDEYIKHKDTYGKTIIFALNGIHCMALDDAFKA
ncbi:MAG: DEAD/DEAH box helicase family protein, partial [Selenomonadaceae bacterium]|nr:DEAD/DEAH box helicase family protein [Selenomonadaceae bacterium]